MVFMPVSNPVFPLPTVPTTTFLDVEALLVGNNGLHLAIDGYQQGLGYALDSLTETTDIRFLSHALSGHLLPALQEEGMDVSDLKARADQLRSIVGTPSARRDHSHRVIPEPLLQGIAVSLMRTDAEVYRRAMTKAELGMARDLLFAPVQPTGKNWEAIIEKFQRDLKRTRVALPPGSLPPACGLMDYFPEPDWAQFVRSSLSTLIAAAHSKNVFELWAAASVHPDNLSWGLYGAALLFPAEGTPFSSPPWSIATHFAVQNLMGGTHANDVGSRLYLKRLYRHHPDLITYESKVVVRRMLSIDCDGGGIL